MERNYPDFIEAFVKSFSHLATPPQYLRWAAIASVAGIIGRRGWVRYNAHDNHPNLFIALVGDPASGKSIAINAAYGDVVDQLRLRGDANMLSVYPARRGQSHINSNPDDITPSKLVSFMCARENHVFERELGFTHCSLMVVTSEFGTLVNPNDLSFMPVMTRLWDSPVSYRKSTQIRGDEDVPNPCVTWLSGATPQQFGERMPLSSFEQGIMTRIVAVWGSKEDFSWRNPHADIEQPPAPPTTASISTVRKKYNWATKKLQDDLDAISMLQGVFTFEPEAQSADIEWQKSGCEPVPTDPRLKSYRERRPQIIAKLSTILSAARRDNKIITVEDWKDARSLLEEGEKSYDKCFQRLGSSAFTPLYEEITKKCWRWQNGETRKIPEHLLQRWISARVDNPVLINPVIDALVNSRYLKIAGADVTVGARSFHVCEPEETPWGR